MDKAIVRHVSTIDGGIARLELLPSSIEFIEIQEKLPLIAMQGKAWPRPELPTRRVVLYGEAVEVLLRTWNVEGHAPIDLEEALPQLCYVAYAMMQNGVQKISRARLAALLTDAREQLTAELGFATVTVGDFIDRVEYRSSLLSMTGQDIEDGMLTEFYEFRHLTFQEYLTARAVVEGWYSERGPADTLVSALWPHVEDEKWREVILLASALGKKESDKLIRQLTLHLPAKHSLVSLLAQCLADEAPAEPETVRQALKGIILNGENHGGEAFFAGFARGRYGRIFREQAGLAYEAGAPNLEFPAKALVEVFNWQIRGSAGYGEWTAVEKQCAIMLGDQVRIKRCEGALMLVALAKQRTLEDRENHVDELPSDVGAQQTQDYLRVGECLKKMLFAEHSSEHHAACMVLGSVGKRQFWTQPIAPEVLWRLMTLGAESRIPEVSNRAKAVLFAELQMRCDPKSSCVAADQQQLEKLVNTYDQLPDSDMKLTTLLQAWQRHAIWHEPELAKRVVLLVGTHLCPPALLGATYLLTILAQQLTLCQDVPIDLKEGVNEMLSVLLEQSRPRKSKS